MVSFTPKDEQQQLIDVIKRFAVDELQPAAHAADENEHFPTELIQTGWEIGLIQSAIPEEYGGLGELSAVTGVLAAEALAKGDLSMALAILSPALVAYPLMLDGTAAQREQFLPLFAGETPPILSAALLEPGIFFDPHDLKTTATRDGDGDGFALDGEKAYVPLGARADWLLVYAKDSETGVVGGYLVDASSDGITRQKREALMGVRALPLYRVKLDGVRVPDNMKLDINYGRLISRSQVALAALAVGVADAAAEYARNYAKQRVQFGVPIAQKQAIAFMLAEMAIEVDAARLLVWEAAAQLDAGVDATKEAYLAKQYADKTVMFVTDSAVQTLGGYGFIREYPAERWLRNARGFTTFHGLAMI